MDENKFDQQRLIKNTLSEFTWESFTSQLRNFTLNGDRMNANVPDLFSLTHKLKADAKTNLEIWEPQRKTYFAYFYKKNMPIESYDG